MIIMADKEEYALSRFRMIQYDISLISATHGNIHHITIWKINLTRLKIHHLILIKNLNNNLNNVYDFVIKFEYHLDISVDVI